MARAALRMSRALSTQGAAEVRHIFAYGSLRPDDDSGQEWTKAFVAGMTQRKGSVGPAALYEEDFACAVLLDGGPSRIVGWALGCDDAALFDRRLAEADVIEEYVPDGSGDYDRAAVDVRLDEGGTVKAWVYHVPRCLKEKHIPSGDWLQRDTKQH
ncbi:hypothetical protein M885DRAFT_516512 [Pelagophyceae sp. CCMP2097]|nr:hypothetical protein M885DRAFT_516512 [Pelagophyceae sp. CCMP2097]|mmetsp:Transcript_14188/g.49361  ORF Transcript_14188/g.49361 Transcript_14188/m.49361 type:complete len:156 (+) Transcript_14188:64-531(+)